MSSSLLSFLVVSPYFCHRLPALAIFLLWPPCPNPQHCAGHRLLCHPLHRASASHLLHPSFVFTSPFLLWSIFSTSAFVSAILCLAVFALLDSLLRVVIFRDGTYLTLKEVFESLD
ncbi:uncharacterized protein [Arachis hypogaea]|uniref:uncharacterized protein n=1 Tax=Arachis hypogaea TaxID=3818 RepID=UPI000DECC7B3